MAAVAIVEVSVEPVTLVPRLELASASPLVALIELPLTRVSPSIGLSKIDSREPEILLCGRDPCVGATGR